MGEIAFGGSSDECGGGVLYATRYFSITISAYSSGFKTHIGPSEDFARHLIGRQVGLDAQLDRPRVTSAECQNHRKPEAMRRLDHQSIPIPKTFGRQRQSTQDVLREGIHARLIKQ